MKKLKEFFTGTFDSNLIALIVLCIALAIILEQVKSIPH